MNSITALTFYDHLSCKSILFIEDRITMEETEGLLHHLGK